MNIFVFRKKAMNVIRNIGSIFVVTLLIASTGGFSIYNHVCYCLGNSSSIIIKATCKHENSNEESSCCSIENKPSCCAEKPIAGSKTCFHKDHCCQTSSQFLKISDSFQPGLEKISLKPFVVASALLFFDIPADESTIPSLNLFNADLPPPDSGKQILVAHHQLKIAPALV